MPTHNSRVRPITDPWANIQSYELGALDSTISEGINGVEGSTHSPPAAGIIGHPITISGSGLRITGPLTVARGGTVTATAAGAIVLDGGYPFWQPDTNYAADAVVVPLPLTGRRYQCTTPGISGASSPSFPTAYGATVQDGAAVWTCLGPDGDVPQYTPAHAGRTPTVVHSLAGGHAVIPGTWRVRNVDGMVQAIAPMMDLSDGNGPQVARWVVPLRMHDVATVTSVSVSLRVGWPHTNLPNAMPGARLLRLPTSGVPQFLTSVAAGADTSGYAYLKKPTTAAAWTGQQTLTFTCDQNNLVDIANYTYVLELIEEQWSGGPSYPWSLVTKQPVRLATNVGFGNPHNTGYSIDGVVVNAGDRVLVKDSIYASGILIAVTGGSWTPAPDFTLSSDFTQGVIVPVAIGTTQGGSYWQAASNQSTWAGSSGSQALTFVARGPDDVETPYNTGTEFFGHGCIWGAASVSYTGITQQDFQ